MSDEQAPDEVQDTPNEDATLQEDTAQEQPEVVVEETTDWEKRYHDLQPEYTRATQRVKELEGLEDWKPLLDDLSNPETRQQALEWLNSNFAPDEDGEGFEDDDDLDEGFYDPRVDTLLEREQQRDLEQQFGEFEKHLSGLIEEKSLQLSDRQRRALVNECIDAGFSPESTQKVVEEWAKELSSFHDDIIKQYVEGKRKQPPPAVKPGASGTEHVPLDTERKRRDAALRIANEAFAD